MKPGSKEVRWLHFETGDLEEIKFGLQMTADQGANTTESDMLLEEVNKELSNRKQRSWDLNDED